ncbi:MAG: ROK family protein [Pseudanabaenaceae cyanobacterium bins.68]|nr:ROK family protein [Pseudanabaenaceae cyanobacterium bins.68]
MNTLAIDVGGSGIKAMLLDSNGVPLSSRLRQDTPQPAKPEAVIFTIAELAQQITQTTPGFDRVSVGFPGVVSHGVTRGAINLGKAWDSFPLADRLEQLWQKPVRVANDADVQGYGAVKGLGVELVITLGTGFGSALFLDGKLVPNLEMGQHMCAKDKTYEQLLGNAALEKIGEKDWNQRLSQAIASLELLFNFDYLYIGGGNAKKVSLEFPAHIQLVSNQLGLTGGIALWRS